MNEKMWSDYNYLQSNFKGENVNNIQRKRMGSENMFDKNK